MPGTTPARDAASRRALLKGGAVGAVAGSLATTATGGPAAAATAPTVNVGSPGAAVAAGADTGSSPWVISGGDIYFGAPAGGATETFAESFERGTVGSLPSASTTSYDHTIGDNGDSGGNVDAAFDTGGVSGQCVRFWNAQIATATWGFLGKNLTPTNSLYVRRYVKIDKAPIYRTSFLLAKYGGIHGAHHGSVAVGGRGQGGAFVLVNVDTNATVSQTLVPIGQWFRVEWHADLGQALQTLRVFVGANLHGTVPDEELSAPIYAGQKIDYLEDGILTNPQVLLNVWVDEAVDDSATWPGPLAPAGDVGIGTSSPRHKLDVKGDASFDGDVVVTGTLTASNLGPTGSTAGPGYGPPPGGYLMPSNLTAISATAVTPGVVTFVPVDVGPRGLSAAALVVSCSAAEVGGTTSTVLGVYPDDGSGGLPDCSNGPLVSGQVTLTATGVRSVTVSKTLPPGRYWAACGYFATAAPGTLPKVTCNNQSSSSVTLWNQAFPAIVRYLFLSGRTSLPLAAPSGFSCGTDGGGIVVGVRAG